MKHLKIYIVTYKRSDILNDTLTHLFNSDFSTLGNTEVNVINNHTSFYLEDRFKDRVNVLHNVLRPDWSNGNLAENWNQALLNGFKSLSRPDCEYLVTMQNDTVVHPEWCQNLLKMHEKYDFIVGRYGDNLVSYTPEAVRKIGIWDENFYGIQYKEADYWIRALAFNKDKSCINDTLHGLELNNHDALELDIAEGRNFIEEQGFNGSSTVKRRADDSEHQQIWSTRSGIYKEFAWKYFYTKWNGTWKSEPQKNGWVKQWSKDFIENPPDIRRSSIKSVIKYLYFEKDIYDLGSKNYLV
tara:strand:+ start:176 stop:1069 length:894 start_codon:yes stop_codon:yes gene_type:complete